MTGIYRNSPSKKITRNQKMTRDPFDIPEIARLRDWANACVERDALHRKQSITIKAPLVTTYKVKSLNSSKVYSLTERNDHWTCNCPAMQFYSNRGYCKHIRGIKKNA